MLSADVTANVASTTGRSILKLKDDGAGKCLYKRHGLIPYQTTVNVMKSLQATKRSNATLFSATKCTRFRQLCLV